MTSSSDLGKHLQTSNSVMHGASRYCEDLQHGPESFISTKAFFHWQVSGLSFHWYASGFF